MGGSPEVTARAEVTASMCSWADVDTPSDSSASEDGETGRGSRHMKTVDGQLLVTSPPRVGWRWGRSVPLQVAFQQCPKAPPAAIWTRTGWPAAMVNERPSEARASLSASVLPPPACAGAWAHLVAERRHGHQQNGRIICPLCPAGPCARAHLRPHGRTAAS